MSHIRSRSFYAAPDPGPDSIFPSDGTPPAPGWGAREGPGHSGVDYAAVWRQVEAEAARVVVVDLERRHIVAGRAMRIDVGASQHGEAPLERLFPGASSQMERWCNELAAHSGDLVAQSLSPRQWVYFWRLNPKTAMLALVRHRHSRGAAPADDSATVRLLSEHWLAADLQSLGAAGRDTTAPWNRVERRSRAGAPRELWAALVAIGLATLCGLWLALGLGVGKPTAAPTAPPPSAELQRLSKLADETLLHSLTLAMAGRDYGEAQEALAAHLALGHFEAALLLNGRKQVVAHAGLAQPPLVGHVLPAGLPAGAQQLGLNWAGEPIGELIKIARTSTQAPLPASARPSGSDGIKGLGGSSGLEGLGLRITGAVLAAIGLLCGAALWRHLRSRYR